MRVKAVRDGKGEGGEQWRCRRGVSGWRPRGALARSGRLRAVAARRAAVECDDGSAADADDVVWPSGPHDGAAELPGGIMGVWE